MLDGIELDPPRPPAAPGASSGTLLVFRPGAKVVVGEKITGTVVGVSIGGLGVTYQVAWWDGNCRRAEWLNADEVMADTCVQPFVGIGFHSGRGQP